MEIDDSDYGVYLKTKAEVEKEVVEKPKNKVKKQVEKE